MGRGRFEVTTELAERGPLTVEVGFVVIGDQPGERQMLCTFRDVSKRLAAEKERLGLERKLFEAQRLESLGSLAGGIAHDFNNLLTAILGNISMAEAVLPKEAQAHRFLMNAEKTSLQAAELCKQMLAYAGRGRIVMRTLSLSDLICGMDPLLRISVAKNVTLLTEVASDLPMIEGEPAQLQQIIVNLIINASEAIKDAPGIVRLSVSRADLDQTWLEKARAAASARPGSFVVMEVSDSGPGISSGTIGRIFDPFFTTKFTGRGLGLASVLGIVHRHGGAIRVESESGRGATFKVAFPAKGAAAGMTADERAIPAALPSHGGTILVVDDEEHVRKVAAMMLQHSGFTVLTANNGEDALRVFQEHGPGVAAVLLDLTMPVMDGPTALRHLRAMKPDLPVLLMSGYSETDLTQVRSEYGSIGFLAKPFSHDRHLAEMTALLQSQDLPEG